VEKRRTWIILLVALPLAAGMLLAAGLLSDGPLTAGRMAVVLWPSSLADEPPEPDLETALVTQGDITLTADGSGELVPAAQVDLVFRTGGTLAEVLVQEGDQVSDGDLLARLDTEDLERAVANAEVELEIARLDLADVQDGPNEAELAGAEATLRDARVSLTLAYDAYQRAEDSNLDASIEQRQVDFDWWVGYYQKQKQKFEDGDLSKADHDWAMNAMISAQGELDEAINNAKIEETQSWNRVVQAQNSVTQAEIDLEELRSEPLTNTLLQATMVVDEALMAREKTEVNLEAAQLVAPFDGTIVDVARSVGEQVTADKTVILTLAQLEEPLIQFWVEESDLEMVAVGASVNLIFEALPDDVFAGEVTRVDPMIVDVDGTTAVQCWASLGADTEGLPIVSGMTVDVEVLAAEALDAILVPVEALRETGAGQYEVFVVGAGGELEVRTVEVGLQDYTYAQILSGLELGETVSVGETN